MTSPFQVLCLSPRVPDLVTSAFGPYVVHGASSLEELANQMHSQRFDVILVDLKLAGGLEKLAHWSALPRAVLESALVVAAPEPSLPTCLRLLHLGAREVLSARDVAADVGGDMLGRALRLVIERKKQDDNARRAYSIDLTTGLPNHQQLLEHMNHLLALREREPAAMALIVLHLDGFRAVEASLGAEAANVLRRKAAVRLRSSLRASDVVASLGPDMFGVLLAWIDASDDAEHVATKLTKAVQQPFSVAGQPLPVRAHAGVGRYPVHGKEAKALLDRAVAQAAGTEGGGVGHRLGAAAAANDDSSATEPGGR